MYWLILVVLVLATLFICWRVFFLERRSVNFTGKTVLITGVSANNVGHAFAKIISKTAKKLVLVSFKGEDVIRMRTQLSRNKAEIVIVEEDLTKRHVLPNIVRELGGNLDLLILLHTVSSRASASDTMIVDKLRTNLEVNLLSSVRLVQEVLPLLAKSSEPRIMVSSALDAHVPMPMRSAYASSKAALAAFFQCFAVENPHIETQILVPGLINTPAMRREYDEEIVSKFSVNAESMAMEALQSEQAMVYLPWYGFIVHAFSQTFPNFVWRRIPELAPSK
eukprot:TRINITY_DN331_c0_g1_i3.p1 TRINITY_DN331_c0_g1~~TRINITY_DN331_c0_g1_i3.p1  ORF type:complete len:279 (-),score=39.55 TRINITY_DN331_c0_g1_i3:22-858(-)